MSSVADALHAILSDIFAGRLNRLGVARPPGTSLEDSLRSDIVRLIRSMRTRPFSMRCGFSIQGAHVLAASSIDGSVAIPISGKTAAFVEVDTVRPTSVLIELADGSSTVLPAIPDFVAVLVFRKAELVHVSYEPSWAIPSSKDARRRRALAAALSVAAGLGSSQLHLADIDHLTVYIDSNGPNFDPAVLLYAAYVFQDAGMRQRIKDLAFRFWLNTRAPPSLFDLSLLANQLRGRSTEWLTEPAFPVLSRGWSLLNAFGAVLPPEWKDLQQHLQPSLWSLFSPEGTKQLRTIFKPRREP